MRCLIISDLHANLQAFQAVLDDAEGDYDYVWCLGDVVGYGPDPNGCVELLRSLPHLCIAGNHDWAALGRLDVRTFNADARRIVNWTRETLSPESLEYLDALPTLFVLGDYTLVHGSPREPIWEYVLDPLIAALNFKHFRTTYCFVGHTHSPVAFRQVSDLGECEQVLPTYDTPIPLGDKRQIVNPGSTGQPRDSNPRAAYAILNLDDDTLERRRVEYDIEAVQVKMEAEGLPERMIMRLSHGW